MFLGEYTPKFAKGNRLALPKKLRDNVEGGQVVLTRGLEECILGFDKRRWLSEAEKHMDKSIFDKESVDLKRYLYSGAAEVEMDGQGRVVVPSNLRDYAQLQEEAVIIGVGDHFEIWNRGNWEKKLNSIQSGL